MSDGPVMLERPTAQRIVNATRRVERMPNSDGGEFSNAAPGEFVRTLSVKVTAIAASARGKYSGEVRNTLTGSGPTFHFYNLAEVASGIVMLAVDDEVTIVNWPKARLDALLGITTDAGDNWACYEYRVLVEEDEGSPSPSIKNVQRIAVPADSLTDNSNKKVTLKWFTKIRKNSSGGGSGPRKTANLIEGTDISLTVADDAGNDEVDITIAFSGSSGAALGEAKGINWQYSGVSITNPTLGKDLRGKVVMIAGWYPTDDPHVADGPHLDLGNQGADIGDIATGQESLPWTLTGGGFLVITTTGYTSYIIASENDGDPVVQWVTPPPSGDWLRGFIWWEG